MVNIPTQAGREVVEVYRTWQQHGLGPDSAVELGDGTSMTLRELLGESDEQEQ